jgi:hypothetical protein
MAIVTTSYRPKRARKRKPRSYPESMPSIVTPSPMQKRRRPVIGDEQQQTNDNGQEQPRRPAIVEPKQRNKLAGVLNDYDPEEHRRAGEKADELFREIVRRATKA